MLEMTQLNPRQARIMLRDAYENPIPAGVVETGEVSCMTETPSLFAVVVEPDPHDPFWALRATLTANDGDDYQEITCTHTPSGASNAIDLAHPPLNIFTVDPDYWPDAGFPAESFFDVFVEVPPPPVGLAPAGWAHLVGSAIVDVSTGATFEGCSSTDPSLYDIECVVSPMPPEHIQIDFTADILGGGGMMGNSVPISMTFQAPYVDPALIEPISGSLQVTQVELRGPANEPIPTNFPE